MWLNVVCPSADLSNSIRWHNYQLVITAPDGTNTTQSWSVCWDTTSAQDYSFTPTATGTYTFTFKFPGQTYDFPVTGSAFGTNAGSIGNIYDSISASCTLTVQSTPIAGLSAAPLPTSYWTRPIYGENSNWWAVSSNWLGDGAPGYTGFAGTNGYYASSESTSFTVMQASATQAPTATPLSGVATQNALEYIGVAIIIVIVIIGAVLALLVTRKHP